MADQFSTPSYSPPPSPPQQRNNTTLIIAIVVVVLLCCCCVVAGGIWYLYTYGDQIFGTGLQVSRALLV